jgi:AraC-like DNA-binding protein
MPVIYHIPAPPLDAYISGLIYCDQSMPYVREKILPFPLPDLKINFGGTLHAYEREAAKPFATCVDSWCVGLWNEYHVVEWPPDLRFFMVVFKPCGAYPFVRVPLSELHNQVVSLDTLWGSSAAEIRERLHATPTLPEQFALLEQLLLERLREAPPGLPIVQYAVAEIARNHGAVSIQALSDRMGVSQKHLIALFKRLVGGTPKELARMVRFAHVLSSIDMAQPANWTRLAHQTLYYDQSHFNKDFDSFTGHTPTDYLRLRRRVRAEHPEHATYLRQLPTG